MNTQEFIKKSKEIHGDRYDYSKTVFSGTNGRLTIGCNVHGDFQTTAYTHLKGSNCIRCAGKAKKTTEEFVAELKALRGDEFDYSKVIYVNSKSPVEIICKTHGSFFAKPNNLISNNSGCPVCSNCEKLTLEKFIERAKSAHGDKYDYSKSVYKNIDTKILINCKEHGDFWQIPYDHLKGRGCIPCGIDKCATSNRRSLKAFIIQSIKKHGAEYDYSRVIYKNAVTQIEIVCSIHGAFFQTPNGHLDSTGCPNCSTNALVSKEEFINRSINLHGEKYEYQSVVFKNMNTKVFLTCKIHGDFLTLPKDHIQKKSGCPKCAREATSSKQEIEVAEWLEAEGFEVIRNDREILNGFEIDIFIPSAAIGIEFHGAYWHHDDRLNHPRIHETKALRAEKYGITLISVWDFDWITKKEFIKKMILHRLGKSEAEKFNARDGIIKTVSSKVASEFYDITHIQGAAWRAKENYGLFINEKLVACMSFSQAASRRGKTGNQEWELVRYSTDGIVRGGASKLYSKFINDYAPEIVWSYSDRQHFSGKLYTSLGFDNDGSLPADYKVYHQNSNTIWHKSAWQRRHIQTRLIELNIEELYDHNTDTRTEKEMQALAGVLRIRDSGKIRWKWTKKTPH